MPLAPERASCARSGKGSEEQFVRAGGGFGPVERFVVGIVNMNERQPWGWFARF